MFKKFYYNRFMLTFIEIFFLLLFVASMSYAGGPENPSQSTYKKGKIKGVVTAVRDAADGCVSISLAGRCQKKASPEYKYINENFCDCCWVASDDNFNNETETSLLETVRFLEVPQLEGCFSDDYPGDNQETLEISDVREFYNSGETITAVVTVKALE